MNHEKLSRRLERVAVHIPKGSILADIGSDHAYLPCYAVREGLAAAAVAGEVVEGPYQSAVSQVRQSGLTGQISVRKGDGLAVLEPGEAGCVTICGMGGALIASILEAGREKLSGRERLILQPNIAAGAVREWLLENGWELTGEEILEEDGKIYEILIADPGDPEKPYGADREKGLRFGPFLMKEQNETFRKKWLHEKSHWERIASGLNGRANKPETEKRLKELTEQIRQAEEVLNV